MELFLLRGFRAICWTLLVAASAQSDLRAQQGCKVWDRRFGGTSTENVDGSSAAAAVGGGYFLGTNSFSGVGGDHTQANQGLQDMWVVRIDGLGVKLWDRNCGGTGNDWVTSVTPTSDGGCLLVGYSQSGIGGDHTEASRGVEDYWVVRLDAFGIKLWDKTFGSPGADMLHTALQTSDGGFFLIGNSAHGTGGDKTQTGVNGTEIWIVRTDASGVKLWDKVFANSSGTLCHSALLESNGDVVLGGSADGAAGGDVSQGPRGDRDCWVVRMSSAGVKLWDRRFGGPGGDETHGIAKANDGGYWVTAWTGSGIGGEHSQDLRGAFDYWLLKLDASGLLSWERRFGGTATDYPNSVLPMSDGGVIVGGASGSQGNGDQSMPPWGSWDYWLVKVTSTGTKQWDAHFGGTGSESGGQVLATSDGAVLIAGSSASGISGDVSQTAIAGSSDIWVYKMNGAGAAPIYRDVDSDGFGDPAVSLFGCLPFAGYVGNSTDNCPNVSGVIGGACSDGNACTVNDALNASCQCVGTTTGDTDGDGVCDGADNCPNVTGQQGSACNDGNNCTINDVLNASCICAGTLQDTDGDGVCNAQDNCPSVTGQVGSSCSDGNACTINDVLNASCVCVGTASGDTDGDGICNGADNCPNIAGQIGSSCNDGVACTFGDALNAACQCTGTLLDSDGDGICNSNDNCPNVVGQVGSACNDGNACTLNDALNAGCVCTGTLQDTDGDGICNLNDNCPNVVGQIGSSCSDGNACTTGDVLNASCQCVGTTSPDSDGDGICNALDNCPNVTGQVGSSCNDGNASTTNDVINASCICAGTIVIPPACIQWDRRFGGSDYDWAQSQVATADGGMIIAGMSRSGISGDKTQASLGNDDLWLVKLDANKNKVWDKRYGSTGMEYGMARIALAADGDLYVGCIPSSGTPNNDITQTAPGAQDYWIMRLNSEGTKLWDKRFGGSSSDLLESLIVTNDGGFLLGGSSQSGISGDKTEGSRGGYDYWVVKGDASGNKEWDKRFGGSQSDRLHGLVQTADGGYLLSGYSSSGAEGDRTEASRGTSDYWIVRIDANGVKSWDRRFGTSSIDQAYYALALANGNFLVSGISSGSGADKSQGTQGGADYWLVMVDPDGNKLWDKRFGGSGSEAEARVVEVGGGGFLISGWTSSSISGDKSEASRGGYDIWLVRTDASGTKLWDKTLGGTGSEDIEAPPTYANGWITLPGQTDSPAGFEITDAPRGSVDFWIIGLSDEITPTWYPDNDGDGLGAATGAVQACTRPAGYVFGNLDCNDNITGGVPGLTCDDGNANTTNDVWGSDCVCAGISAPCMMWDARFGGTSSDILTSAIRTTDGGYLVGGRSSSSANGDKSQTAWGGSDYWILKTSAAGVKEWDKRFGTGSTDYLTAMIATADGNYLLGGYTTGGISGDKTQASQGLSDYWVVKVNASGTKLWDRRFGGSADDLLMDLALASDGGYLLAGSSSSGISGDRTEDTRGLQDQWLVKVDANGTKLWDKRFGGAANDLANDVLALSDGYLLVGPSASGLEGDRSLASQGGDDLWAVKTDLNGTKLWDRRFGGTSTDGTFATATLSGGSIYIACNSSSGIGGDKSEAGRGGTDYWLVKCGTDGVKLWDKRFGTTSTDNATRVEGTTNGVVLAGSSSGGVSGDRTEASRGSSDLWVLRVNSSGVKVQDKRYGSPSSDDEAEFIVTPDGGYLLAGNSSGTFGGDRSWLTRGSNDYWLVKNTPGSQGTWYADVDNDGYGNPGVTTSACELPTGYVSVTGDCDLNSATSYPGASCSDGNGCTTSDVLNASCQCIGNISGDTDGDGTCNALDGCQNDPNKIAPGVCGCSYPEPGTPCSDNNDNTGNDVISASCTCVGVPLDCENVPGGTAATGQTCDDNDPWTSSTSYDASCGCAGTPNACKRYDKRYGTTSTDYLRALVATSDGGQLMAMEAYSNTGNVAAVPDGGGDFFVFRTNADGGIVWQQMFGGSGAEIPYAAVATSDGGFLIGGSSASGISGDRSQSSQGGLDYWVIRVDANGTKVWDKRFGGSGADQLKAIAATADGGFVLLGDSDSPVSGDKTTAACYVSPSIDLWVLKISSSGALVWQTLLGGYYQDYPRSVAVAPDGSILVGATTESSTGCTVSQYSYDQSGAFSYGDYWITKLNSSGVEQWDKRFGGNAGDDLSRAMWTSDGGTILFGTSLSTVGGTRTAGVIGGSDVWVVKTDANGIKQWDRAFGGTSTETVYDAVAVPTGGWMVVASTTSPVGVDVTGTPRGNSDLWVLRLGNNGRRSWDLRYGTTSYEHGQKIAIGSDGWPVLGARSDGGINGDKTQSYWGQGSNQDIWVLKLDAGRTWYQDQDGDGFGASGSTAISCTKPVGYVSNTLDCNDGSASIYPGALCDDGIAGNASSVYSNSCVCAAPAAMCRQWDKRFGSSGDDQATDIISTSDGGYLIGGWSDGGLNGDRSEDSRGNEDYWVVKVDANGTKQWDKRFGGSSFEILTCLLQTPDGGYLLGGWNYYTSSGGDIASGHYGNTDFWVVKIDANGTKQWDRHYGGYDLDWMEDMVIAPDGGYLFAGLTWSSDGQVSQTAHGQDDYWVIKVDANGVKQWDKRYGGTGADLLYKVVNTSDGNYALCGESNSPSGYEKSENSRGGVDIWVVKINTTGGLLWERTLGGSGHEAGYALAAGNDGGVAVGARSSSAISGDRTWPLHSDGDDAWVVRLDGAGTKLWDRAYGGQGADQLWDMESTGDGGFYIGLASVYTGGDCTSNDNGLGFDQWVGRLDASGVKLWDRGYIGGGQTEFKAIAASSNGLAMLAVSSSNVYCDRSENSRGNFDYWTVALAPGNEGEWSTDFDGDGYGQPLPSQYSGIAHACSAPAGFAAPGDCNDNFAAIYPGAVCNDGNAGTSLDQYNASCVCAGTTFTVKVAAKVFLDGPFVAATTTMSDGLRTAGLIPATEPFTGIGYTHTGGGGGETRLPGVLNVSGNNAIVDWVVVELRNNSTPATVVATSSALVQRDGDVVDMDGVSSLGFNVAAGTYKVATRHRNHLGVMTLNGVALSSNAALVDFTTTATAAYGTNARKTNGTKQTLWPGDVVRDGLVKYTGATNDRDPVLVAVGSTTPNNTVAGYRSEDVNLDGSVRYTGSANDRDVILQVVGGTTPTNTVQQQLP